MDRTGSHNAVWVVSELYYPEESATGYFLTNIAEGLARNHVVKVLSGQPTYEARGVRAPRTEHRNGVSIRRCLSTTFDKNILFARLANLVTISSSMFVRGMSEFKCNDIIVVVTNPPTLPFFMLVASRLKGAKCWLLVHDVYPDALVAAKILKRNGVADRILDWFSRWLYRSVEHIIVLGRDMEDLIVKKIPESQGRVSIIPNWADINAITPLSKENNSLLEEVGLSDKFIVQYSGNMGRTHGLECLLRAATKLRANTDVHFLLIGSGAKKAWFEQEAHTRGLSNVTILPVQPRSALKTSLNACDVAVVSFVPGMAGVSVPSRMYNILAAGKPIIAVADAHSELALVIREERIGWVIVPEDSDQLAACIEKASNSMSTIEEMGARARAAAVQKYSYKEVISSYNRLIRDNSASGQYARQRDMVTDVA